jgi:uncharacterized damage-inducible protein DinB
LKAADLYLFRHELRAGTLRAVNSLPDAHLEWKPTGGVHSILSWLWHIAQVEDGLVQTVVQGRPDHEPRRQLRLTGRDEALDYLSNTRTVTDGLLSEWDADRLWERRTVRGTTVSLYDLFHRVFQHEAHHRAQIYLQMRLMGLEPPRGQ